jgi:hypothetical protein
MVDMEVTEEEDVRLRHLRPALAESKSAATARIEDDLALPSCQMR